MLTGGSDHVSAKKTHQSELFASLYDVSNVAFNNGLFMTSHIDRDAKRIAIRKLCSMVSKISKVTFINKI